MILIPQQDKKFSQPNDSDNMGNLYVTYNCDFLENRGRVCLGKRLILNINESSNGNTTNLGLPVAFKEFGLGALTPTIYAIAGAGASTGRVFVNTGQAPSLAFIEDTTSGVPVTVSANVSDMEVFKENLWVTTSETKIYYLKSSDSTWNNFTATGISTTDRPKILCAYGGRMYCSFGVVGTGATSQIGSWSTANGSDWTTTSTNTLTFNDANSNNITAMESGSNRIWICTLNTLGGTGSIYEWDGVSTQFTKQYKLEASGALACVIKDDVPWVLDTNANLLKWNGGTFVKVAGFNRVASQKLYHSSIVTNNRFIHTNGITIVEGKINILIKNLNEDGLTSEETIPSGVWEFDPENPTLGLTHKYSVGLSTSAGTITDYGANRIDLTGALVGINTRTGTDNGQLLAGSWYFTDSSNVKYGIHYDDTNDTLQKSGYFITPKIDSQNLTDTWGKVIIRHKPFLAASDKVIVKYKTVDVSSIVDTITWTSTTTFTVGSNVTGFWTAGTGGEVEILQGIGSGKCSHITSVVSIAGGYSVTVDETYTGATGTSVARFTNWIKAGIIQDSEDHAEVPVEVVSGWIQLKVTMLFTGKNEINQLILTNKPHEKYE